MSGAPTQVSPLAPAGFPDLPVIAGVDAAIGRAGFYKYERPDVLLVRCTPGTRAAGVFTTNAVGSAPTDWCKQALTVNRGQVRGLLVNAGCANSFTGQPGAIACRNSMEAAAEKIGAPAREMMAASTGVIGVVLDDAKITAALPRMELQPIDWRAAAEAIMTTDTFPKGAGARCQIEGVDVAIAGICKGSGMIAPNMATMLAFVFTDAAITAPILKSILRDENETSFNSITVDGDRSTNDCVLVMATGAAKVPPISDANDPRLTDFRAALSRVLADLAIQIVRDGEGATKFVTVRVTGATNDLAAKKIARTICESPLVKTAIAGEDANWGRIVAAAGRADQPMQRELMSVRFGELWAAKDGAVAANYDEAAMSAYMKQPELEITVNVGPGMGAARMYTCDLTKRYVEINGDYRS
ncbi:MAG: bifunctional glutamate N-acetyltransferase/amino-acid acetyltransferase ArgJ [Pseudomonadota bacterium]